MITMELKWSDEDKAFIACAPDLQGVITHGDTPMEAMRNLLEAIELHLEAFDHEKLKD